MAQQLSRTQPTASRTASLEVSAGDNTACSERETRAATYDLHVLSPASTGEGASLHLVAFPLGLANGCVHDGGSHPVWWFVLPITSSSSSWLFLGDDKT